jgi:hypothetical protein
MTSRDLGDVVPFLLVRPIAHPPPPDRNCGIFVSVTDISDFLCHIYQVVPAGEESKYVDVGLRWRSQPNLVNEPVMASESPVSPASR